MGHLRHSVRSMTAEAANTHTQAHTSTHMHTHAHTCTQSSRFRAGDMGQCLWGKQSSSEASEARAEGSVTNVASLCADQCGHLEASCRCAYTSATQQGWTDRQPSEMREGHILTRRSQLQLEK